MFVLIQIQKKQNMITYTSIERQNMKNTGGNGIAKGASSPRRDITNKIVIVKMSYFSSLLFGNLNRIFSTPISAAFRENKWSISVSSNL